MKPVQREEVLDYVTYEDVRDQVRKKVLTEKERRRIHLGPNMTFLFENRDTVRYQIQEMMRIERIVKEADIQHEIATYNELLGGEGELGCTLLIEIDDPNERAKKLAAWRDMMAHVYMKFDDGSRVAVVYDRRQVGDERLSSVQYLKFTAGKKTPTGIVVDHPDYRHETTFTEDQRKALMEDLQ